MPTGQAVGRDRDLGAAQLVGLDPHRAAFGRAAQPGQPAADLPPGGVAVACRQELSLGSRQQSGLHSALVTGTSSPPAAARRCAERPEPGTQCTSSGGHGCGLYAATGLSVPNGYLTVFG
jgi:hypothetical protein